MSEPDIEAAYEKALVAFDGEDFDRLSAVEQILVAVRGLEADVNNGGFDQYYFNGSGDHAIFATEALRRIGAHRMAAIVERANSVFGPDGPSGNRFVRQAQLALLAPTDTDGPWEELDREFFEYPDDISALVTQFVRSAR